MSTPDIDIDTKDRNEILKVFDGIFIEASMLSGNELKKHPSGVYFQDVPIEPFNNLCAIPSGKKSGDLSDKFGLMKIDIINNYAYEHVKDLKHLNELLEQPIDWSLFDKEHIVKKLQHIGNYFPIVFAYQPKSLEDLACLIALIRPAKKHLVGEDWVTIKQEIWKKEEGEPYAFKKSHAFGFALMITVQLRSLRDTSN